MNKKTKLVLIFSVIALVIAGIMYVASKGIDILNDKDSKEVSVDIADSGTKIKDQSYQPQRVDNSEGEIEGFAEKAISIKGNNDATSELKIKPGRSIYIIKDGDESKEMLTLTDLRVGDEISAQVDENGELLTIMVR